MAATFQQSWRSVPVPVLVSPVLDFSNVTTLPPNIQIIVRYIQERLALGYEHEPLPSQDICNAADAEMKQYIQMHAAQMQAAQMQAAQMQHEADQAAELYRAARMVDIDAIVKGLQIRDQEARASQQQAAGRRGPPSVKEILEQLKRQHAAQLQASAQMTQSSVDQYTHSHDSYNLVSPPVTTNTNSDMVHQQLSPSRDVHMEDQSPVQEHQTHATYNAPNTDPAQDQWAENKTKEKKQHATAGNSRVTKSKAKKSKSKKSQANRVMAQEAAQQDADTKCLETAHSRLQSEPSKPHVDKPMPMSPTASTQPLTESRPIMPWSEPQVTAEPSSTAPHLDITPSKPQVTAAPSFSPAAFSWSPSSSSQPATPRRSSTTNVHGRKVLSPYIPHSAPVLSSLLPGWFHQTPPSVLRKRSFDEYSDDIEFRKGRSPSPLTGRGNFFKSFRLCARAPREVFEGVLKRFSTERRSFLWPQEELGFASMSHKRRIVMPGAWPETPKSVSPAESPAESPAPAEEQTKSVSDKIIRPRTPSPPPAPPPAAPRTPPPRHVKPAKMVVRTAPEMRTPGSPVSPRMATTGSFSERNHMRFSRQEGDLDLPVSRRVTGGTVWRPRVASAQKTSAGLSGTNPLAAVSQRKGQQPQPAIQPGLPPSRLYVESDLSRPTSSGTDSSVSLRAPVRDTREAIMPAAVILRDVPRELELSASIQTAKVVAEEERRRQEDEQRAAEKKRAEEERRAREEAEEQARRAARAAEREAALSAMSLEEREVLERSRGLFKVLPPAHRETLQDFAQKFDAYEIKGNFKSKDLRSITSGDPSKDHSRPWLNDEAVSKAMEMMCRRANEKAGVSTLSKGGPPAPFHAYSPHWYTSLHSFGDSGMKSWGRRANHLGEGLFQTQAVFLPVCDGQHWRLVVVSGKNRTIQYFDSLGGNKERYISSAKRLMCVFMGEQWNEADWTVIHEQKSPRQRNGSDCGMFAILNMAATLRGREVTQDSYDGAVFTIDYARDWVAAAIIHGGFTDVFDWEDDA